MAARWVGFIIFIAVIFAIIGATAQGVDLSANPEETTLDPNVDTILSYSESWKDDPWGTLVSPTQNTGFFKAMLSLLIGQHSLYSVFPKGSPWMWIWIIFWAPIIGTVVFAILMLFFSILQRVLS